MIIGFNSKSIKSFVEQIKDPNPIHRQENPVLPMDFISSHLALFYNNFSISLKEPFIVEENKNYGLYLNPTEFEANLGKIDKGYSNIVYNPVLKINLKKANSKKLEKILTESFDLPSYESNIESLQEFPYLIDNEISKTILESTQKIANYLDSENEQNIRAFYKSHSVIQNTYGVNKDKVHFKNLKDKGLIYTFIFPTNSKEYLIVKELYIQK